MTMPFDFPFHVKSGGNILSDVKSKMSQTFKRISIDSSNRRSIQNKSSKSRLDLKELRISITNEKLTTLEDRKKITDEFFQSIFSKSISEKKSIKLQFVEDINDISSTTIVNGSLDNTLEYSYVSAGITDNQEIGKRTSEASEKLSSIHVTSDSRLLNCNTSWRVSFRNGNIYEGQLNQDSLMDGKGTFYWNDSTIYQGTFRNGYPCDCGTLILSDLSTYEGDFDLGFFHGNGMLNVKSTPMYYNGEWRLSHRNGKGWLLYETNNWYEGDWINDNKHGQGYRCYSNGDQYKGQWLNNHINGQGCMLWHNNDYYNGEWKVDLPHGYGEYTWNLIPHNDFIFMNYNWYKGNWINGLRSGAGIMNFGYESGARLAGTWLDNKKHGPGVMICGNGITLEKNPLFVDDKPASFLNYVKPVSQIDKKESVLKSYTSIVQQINSKIKLDSLDSELLLNINKNSTNIKMNQYIKLLEKNTENSPPLKIIINNVVHEVDLDYFIREFLHSEGQWYKLDDSTDVSTMEIERIIQTKNQFDVTSISYINYVPSNPELSVINMPLVQPSNILVFNPSDLTNLIIHFLPQLRRIYKIYATICYRQINEDFPDMEPVLVRMFLWQLYRDIGLTENDGISIVEIDKILFKNPNSCLETEHYPWEPIYFWQFLQTLVGIALLLFSKNNKLDYTPTTGFIHHMFKNFLENILIARVGVFQGNCLTHLKDLVSIEIVYELYKAIGEPHSTEEFLRNACLKKEHRVSCFKTLNMERNELMVENGRNIVGNQNQVFYEKLNQTKLDEDIEAFRGLYVFSTLGRRKILQNLSIICPQILLISGKYNLQYRLSFIEFYEAILLLSFEKVEQNFNRIRSTSDVKLFNRIQSKVLSQGTKKRKARK
ncbi:hypothetical protein ABEB36_011847 [Hypothenemus hampei]|uniref:Uncharacterized protein n=1 Tax=Hypothenemus hampei TaxID=57062 RepID=A0ABD1E975_HYPHA